MGSDSDLSIMQEAAKVLDEFGVPYELTIVSAHRTPDRMYSYAEMPGREGSRLLSPAREGRHTSPV